PPRVEPWPPRILPGLRRVRPQGSRRPRLVPEGAGQGSPPWARGGRAHQRSCGNIVVRRRHSRLDGGGPPSDVAGMPAPVRPGADDLHLRECPPVGLTPAACSAQARSEKFWRKRETSSSQCCTESSHCSAFPQGGRNTPP